MHFPQPSCAPSIGPGSATAAVRAAASGRRQRKPDSYNMRFASCRSTVRSSGHSWGTLVAIALALNHRERVRSVVLLSGFYFPRFRFDVLVLSPPAIPVIGDVLRYTISPVLGLILMPLLLRAVFGPSPVPARFAREFPISLMLRPSQIPGQRGGAG